MTTLPPDLTVRPATAADAATLARLRRHLFRDMGASEPELDVMDAAVAGYLPAALADGSYTGWLVEEPGGRPVATVGVVTRVVPPTSYNPGGRVATILGMYVDPAHRRRGLARALATIAVDWCRENGIRDVRLQATEDGRPLYASMGFKPISEMRLLL